MGGFTSDLGNLIKIHYRGIFGGIICVILVLFIFTFPMSKPGEYEILKVTAVKCTWIWMFFSFLLQPVYIAVTGIIPIFMFPLTGILPTSAITACYFNDTIALFLLMGMINQLINQSKVDLRIILRIMCSGGLNKFSMKWLLIKSSAASFLMSIFSNRLMITSAILRYLMPTMQSLSGSDDDPDFNEARYILCNAIQTSSTIGCIVFIHGSTAMLISRGVFSASAPEKDPYPNFFNYMKYTAFALPVAVVMFILNLLYHLTVSAKFLKQPMSNASLSTLKSNLSTEREGIPTLLKCHEILAVLFTFAALAMLLFRFPMWFPGWTTDVIKENAPKVQDATVAAMFFVLLHTLPKDLSFCKFFTADKSTELPPLKPTSAILWWKFVDKNANYGYIFVIGSAIGLTKAITKGQYPVASSVSKTLSFLENMNPLGSMFIIIYVSVALANLMPSPAAAVTLAPASVYLVKEWASDNSDAYGEKPYWAPLAVGLGCTLGFMAPFKYTPAYFSHYSGNVPLKYMIKWGFGSTIICMIVLWLAISFYAPIIFGHLSA